MSTRWVGIGELKRGAGGEILAAVLGSCVSVIVWHPVRRIAFMSHVLLPTRLLEPGGDNPGRYADESWKLLRVRLADEGLALRDCVCHVVGGGRALEKRSASDVGRNNVSRVCELLAAASVDIASLDAGGNHHRLARFDSGNGELSVRRRRVAPLQEAAALDAAGAGSGTRRRVEP